MCISLTEIEGEEGYKSGEKCLKLLFFCPKELIKPYHIVGDGTTLFYPKTLDAVIFLF